MALTAPSRFSSRDLLAVLRKPYIMTRYKLKLT